MKKIRLDIDALEVQSFATVHTHGVRGTVRGAESDAPSYEQSYEGTCDQRVEGCGLREETVDGRWCLPPPLSLDTGCSCPGQSPC